jgi:hypothetical protein
MPGSWEVLVGLTPIEGTTYSVHVHGRKAQVYEVKATVWDADKPAFDVTLPRVAVDNRSAAAKAQIDLAKESAMAEAIRRVKESDWQRSGHYFLPDKTRPEGGGTAKGAAVAPSKVAPKKLAKKM